MKNKNQILKLVLLAMLIAIAVVLQVFATGIKIGVYSPALALVPIAIAGILLGPVGGAIVGTCWGLYIFIFDSSCATFINYSLFGTIVAVIVRGFLVGLLSGLTFKGLKRVNNYAAMITAAIIAPIVNSLTFRLCELAFFLPLLTPEGSSQGAAAAQIMISLFSVLFLIELSISAVLSPAVARICQIGDKQLNLGIFSENKKNLNKDNQTNIDANMFEETSNKDENKTIEEEKISDSSSSDEAKA